MPLITDTSPVPVRHELLDWFGRIIFFPTLHFGTQLPRCSGGMIVPLFHCSFDWMLPQKKKNPEYASFKRTE